MKAKYVKKHNNYDLTLGKNYEINININKPEWLTIKEDDKGNTVMYCANCFEREEYSSVEAAIYALKFCDRHPGWKRICDIKDHDNLYKNWEELSDRVKRPWIREYRESAKEVWQECGDRPCKVPYGFISGKGKFYKKVTDVPILHNLMMIFKVN